MSMPPGRIAVRPGSSSILHSSDRLYSTPRANLFLYAIAGEVPPPARTLLPSALRPVP